MSKEHRKGMQGVVDEALKHTIEDGPEKGPVLDADFAAAQTAVFEADLALSHRVSHAEWARRPLRERLHERLASLIGSQL